MIQLTDVKRGNLVLATFDGITKLGEVIDVNRSDRQIGVRVDESENWYHPQDLTPIQLDEFQLLQLGFSKMIDDQGDKYGRGPFRIRVKRHGDHFDYEIWYREDHRLVHGPIAVHQLQNYHYQMSKMPLAPGSFA